MFVMLAQGVTEIRRLVSRFSAHVSLCSGDQSRGKMIGLKTAKGMATAKNTVMSARAMFLAMGVAN